MKVILNIPQIVVETKEIEVSYNDHDALINNSGLYQKCNFMWENMTEEEKDKIQDISTLRKLMLDYPDKFGINSN